MQNGQTPNRPDSTLEHTGMRMPEKTPLLKPKKDGLPKPEQTK